MISVRQIDAALGLLGRSRKDFAEEFGINTSTFNSYFTGKSSIPSGRLGEIQRWFENAGIYFTRNGVELDDNPIVTLRDPDVERCYLLLLEDVARALANERKCELLITCADDRVSTESVNNAYRKLRANGVAMRQLIEEGNNYYLGPREEYRCIPSRYFINRVTLIYGDNVAIVTSGETAITILRDPVNAERERNNFELLWSMLDPPSESTADEKF